jgi:hypothetical protein
MCMPTQTDVIGFFKTTELLFLVYLVVVAVCLVNPRKAFTAKVEFLNKMLKAHYLQGQVEVTDKAVQNFRRDKWILFFLILAVLFLVQAI